MSTINGVGTFYYRHGDRLPDGSLRATKFFVVFFFPIVPLATERIVKRSVTGSEMIVEVLESLPLAWGDVAWTYLKVWLGVPSIVLAPFLLTALALWAISALGGKPLDLNQGPARRVLEVVLFAGSLWVIVAATVLLGRARRA